MLQNKPIRKEYTSRKSIASALYDNISEQQRDTIIQQWYQLICAPSTNPLTITPRTRLRHVIICQVFVITFKYNRLVSNIALFNTIKLFVIALIVCFSYLRYGILLLYSCLTRNRRHCAFLRIQFIISVDLFLYPLMLYYRIKNLLQKVCTINYIKTSSNLRLCFIACF